ncbi:DUF4956 domain-containing protein [Anaerosphaera multitolerans]|uniref:DUF4956 domain-containing protein n=1 Tax=Anaerosphaera multitolerans TaxID=2487351 RepID=A0A437S9B6_9FIRM|nr:DUF4956 domain-containing protein [Anaerosphaera multitolerans]RVU55716.1 DUF4956 domain-containing protein [Anaerosphaera multitolerans]
MTFDDIFKSGFLENVSSVSIFDMVLAITMSFGLGVFIFLIYKKTYKGVMYSSSFGVTLIGLSMVTTLVILAVTSNVVLSLGMVGALSIVRFRTAIKEPLDLVFLFWSIAAGIVLASGMIPLAVFGSVAIGIVLLIFVNRKTYDNPYILVINCTGDRCEKEILSELKTLVDKSEIKSKIVRENAIELNYEIRLKSEDTSFINRLSQKENVENVVLVSYNGDYEG